MDEKIEQCLASIRPNLAKHRGDVEYVRYDDESKTVFVRFLGTCNGCALADMTLKMGIEALIKEWIPEVKEVVAVND